MSFNFHVVFFSTDIDDTWLSGRNLNGSYTWQSNGRPISLNKWFDSFETIINEKKDCVYISQGYFFTAECSGFYNKYFFMCEKEEEEEYVEPRQWF